MKRRWTLSEDIKIQALHGKMDAAEIAEILNRTTTAVYLRIHKLGLTHKYHYYTKEELNLIRQLAEKKVPVKDMPKYLPGKPYESIIKAAKRYHIYMDRKDRQRKLEEFHDEVLALAAEGCEIHQIAKKYNVTPTTVRIYFRVHNITIGVKPAPQVQKKKKVKDVVPWDNAKIKKELEVLYEQEAELEEQLHNADIEQWSEISKKLYLVRSRIMTRKRDDTRYVNQ